MSTEPRTLSVDIGGIGIKMLVLNEDGTQATERTRKTTPSPASPDRVVSTVVEMAQEHAPYDRVAVGFPGVVIHDIVHTAPNLSTEMWRRQKLGATLAAALESPVCVINDADLQGYGVVSGKGAEMVLTLGTGLGAALFVNGALYPNLELGHHPFKDGKTYEDLVSDAEMRRIGDAAWTKRVMEMLDQLQPIFNYEQLHLGGGNAQRLQQPVPDNVRLFDNAEGLLGGLRLWQRRSTA